MESYLQVGSKVIIQKDKDIYQKILRRKADTCLELQRGQVNLIIKRNKETRKKGISSLMENNDTNIQELECNNNYIDNRYAQEKL